MSPLIRQCPRSNALDSSDDWLANGFYVEASTSGTIPLDKGSCAITGHDLTVDHEIYNLEDGQLTITGHDLESPILGKGICSVVGHNLVVDPIFLATGQITITARTNFGALRLDREIVRIDWSAGPAPLCCLPPSDLERGDFFGVLLTADVAANTEVNFDFSSTPWRSTWSRISSRAKAITFCSATMGRAYSWSARSRLDR